MVVSLSGLSPSVRTRIKMGHIRDFFQPSSPLQTPKKKAPYAGAFEVSDWFVSKTKSSHTQAALIFSAFGRNPHRPAQTPRASARPSSTWIRPQRTRDCGCWPPWLGLDLWTWHPRTRTNCCAEACCTCGPITAMCCPIGFRPLCPAGGPAQPPPHASAHQGISGFLDGAPPLGITRARNEYHRAPSACNKINIKKGTSPIRGSANSSTF